MNTFFFEENVWRGEAPQSYDDLQQLAAKGITAWLHLESGVQRLLPGSWHYGALDWQARLDKVYKFMPMWDFSFPQKNALDWCADTITTWQQERVYVCCKHGMDRTGVVLAYWRVKKCGWTPDDAWAEAQAYGMHKFYLLLGWETKFKELFK